MMILHFANHLSGVCIC